MSGTTKPADSHTGRARTLLCASVLLFPVLAYAGPKVDTVLLKNGDRLTCEILKLQQGRLSVSTDPLDKVSVHWADVVSLVSPSEFEVLTESGDRFYGSLQASVPGEVVVSGFGGAPTTLKLMAVTGIVAIGSSMWKRMDGRPRTSGSASRRQTSRRTGRSTPALRTEADLTNCRCRRPRS